MNNKHHNQITMTCRANLHRKCLLQCHCVCHIELTGIPPETTTPLPPQLHTIIHIPEPDDHVGHFVVCPDTCTPQEQPT